MSARALPIAALLVAMVSIQGGASLAKGLFPILGAQGTTTLRLVFATLILGVVWRPWRKRVARRELRAIAGYGVSLGLMNLLFYFALARIPLGITVALEFAGPLTLSFAASRRTADFLWVALALAGILLILPVTSGSTRLDPLGIAYALAAGAAWASYIVFGQKAGGASSAGAVTTYGMLVAALVVLPLGVAHSGRALLDPALLPVALAVAFFSSALPYNLELYGLKRIPAKNFGILMSLEPVAAALSGLLFLGEKLTLTQWVAIICVMVASLGSATTIRKLEPRPSS
jgi:inner membrane transporter RhtA